jgi:hypothetical protein
MAKARKRRIFEMDRRMEFRLRLAAKKIGDRGPVDSLGEALILPPEREMVNRLIKRVRRL